MKNRVGPPVSGDDFFHRDELIERAWNIIESGNHILIAAPRRVGKTSLMYYLRDNPKDRYAVLYMITESINNENEFYRLLVNKLLKTEYVKKSYKILTFLERHKPTIKKVGPDGVEFGVSEKHDYREMMIRIMKALVLEDKKLIIMLDEFPKTLENIIEDSDDIAGRHFLHSMRELRQDTEISKHIHFMYTGSIGLENLVSKLNAIDTINDLARLKITPLKKEEAKSFIHLLSENVDFELSETIIDYILKKIEWFIPFNIQLIMFEIKAIYRDHHLNKITHGTIDQAIEEMLEQRQHFEHWHTRLRSSLKGNEYTFIKELLNIASEKERISSNEIFNLAVKYQLEKSYKDLTGPLVYDGYINNHDKVKTYRYNSPIVRMWWRQNVAN